MEANFVHLHVHSEYSLIDGIVRIKPMMQAVAVGGMPAVALTDDQSNLFGLVKFYKAAEAPGSSPSLARMCGCTTRRKPTSRSACCCWCRMARGLPQLDGGWYPGPTGRDSTWGAAGWSGTGSRSATRALICYPGRGRGTSGQALLAGNPASVARALAGRLAAAVRRPLLPGAGAHRPRARGGVPAPGGGAGRRRGVPVVATNDVRFLRMRRSSTPTRPGSASHDGRTLDDPRRPRLYSEQQYLRSAGEMEELFSDLPEALDKLGGDRQALHPGDHPGQELPAGFPHARRAWAWTTFLRAVSPSGAGCAPGADSRYRQAPDYADRRKANTRDRLEIELDVIMQMGFPGYFLIVADFIQWAKDNDIPVGPGRGSGAGSLVAYALKITDLDPLPFDLLFERFLNPERVSMPDFDIDFCMEKRDRVIDYVADRYGRDAVSQIITYGTMAAKAVVRDVGRVLGHPYGFVDRIAKLIPFEVGMTLEKALKESRRTCTRPTRPRRGGQGADRPGPLPGGVARNAGKHAGGVVIAPGKLTDFSPLYCEPSGEGLVTQFDKDDVEQVGLVKFDFLGLRTLTIIDWALKTVNAQRAQRGVPGSARLLQFREVRSA